MHVMASHGTRLFRVLIDEALDHIKELTPNLKIRGLKSSERSGAMVIDPPGAVMSPYVGL